MALPQISVSDFVGEIRLSQDAYQEETSQEFIDEKYQELVRQILGDHAYSEILAAVSLPAKWSDLLNGTTYTNSRGSVFINDGLVKGLKYWIWHSLFAQDFQNTTTGNVVNANENSTRLGGGSVSSMVGIRWNKGANIIYWVYLFIDEFSNISQNIIDQTDNADNTYTFDVSANKYLAVDDIIEINGRELTVTAVVSNASITADAGEVGLTFSGPIKWHPFEKYDMPLPVPSKSSGF